MDMLDRRLLQILERDARITYRELSERLNISIPSIQKRIISLEESRRIRGYTANITPQALGASFVVIQGSSEADFIQDKVDELGKNDSVTTVICGGRNRLVLGVYLRDISELDEIVSYVREVGEIPCPEVLMLTPGSDVACTRMTGMSEKPRASDLTGLDYRIIQALHDDARRSVSDVAAEVGISSKTVSRRLTRLLEKGLIDFHVLGFPNLDEDLPVIIMVRLKPNSSRQKVIERVRKIPGHFIDEDLSFSNAPNLVMFTLFMQTLSELNDLLYQIMKVEGVEGVTHDVLIHQQFFETWRDRLLYERARQALPENTTNGTSDAV